MRASQPFGKYRLLERIAVGGMAEVFVAAASEAPGSGAAQLVAIKKMLPTLGEDPELVTMFVDEARIAVQLEHPNIVRVVELGKHDDTLYIAMEYVSGRDLRQLQERLRKRGRKMPIPLACHAVARVCDALDYAHRRRDAHGRPLAIVHRDVSPQNVLAGWDGAVKLIDFGIAKAESRMQRTQQGTLKGKLSYMSPEQVKGEPVDARSDLFACGILLWELLCGEKLFAGDSDYAILDQVRAALVPAPSTRRAGLPPQLERVVEKALQGDPAARFQSAGALRDALLAFAAPDAQALAQFLRDELRDELDDEQARLRIWHGLARDTSHAGAHAPRPRAGDFSITPADPFPAGLESGARRQWAATEARPPRARRRLAIAAGATLAVVLLVAGVSLLLLPALRPGAGNAKPLPVLKATP